MRGRETVTEQRQLSAQRWRLLRQLSILLDKPMTALAFVWLLLLVWDLTRGLSGALLATHYVIWFIFGLHFALEFVLAPGKWSYLRRNWVTALALLLPALRVFRVLRAFRAIRAVRAARSLSLMRVVTSLNRGVSATRRTLRHRGAGYVAALTLLTTFTGAAAMYSF
jgi:voltage-gated potassium channel